MTDQPERNAWTRSWGVRTHNVGFVIDVALDYAFHLLNGRCFHDEHGAIHLLLSAREDRFRCESWPEDLCHVTEARQHPSTTGHVIVIPTQDSLRSEGSTPLDMLIADAQPPLKRLRISVIRGVDHEMILWGVGSGHISYGLE